MNFLELQERVIERIDEDATTPVYWTRDEIKEAINKAQRRFTLYTLCIERTDSFDLSANTAFYSIESQITDFIVPLKVVTSSGARIRPYKFQELDMESSSWRSTNGTPDKYAQAGYDLLAVTPQPSAGGTSISITYAATPAVLSANDDEPEIPEENHQDLIDFAIWWLRLKEGGQEHQKTMELLERFIAAARKRGEFQLARSQGQLYDHVPPDLSRFDRGRFNYKLKQISMKGAQGA